MGRWSEAGIHQKVERTVAVIKDFWALEARANYCEYAQPLQCVELHWRESLRV